MKRILLTILIVLTIVSWALAGGVCPKCQRKCAEGAFCPNDGSALVERKPIRKCPKCSQVVTDASVNFCAKDGAKILEEYAPGGDSKPSSPPVATTGGGSGPHASIYQLVGWTRELFHAEDASKIPDSRGPEIEGLAVPAAASADQRDLAEKYKSKLLEVFRTSRGKPKLDGRVQVQLVNEYLVPMLSAFGINGERAKADGEQENTEFIRASLSIQHVVMLFKFHMGKEALEPKYKFMAECIVVINNLTSDASTRRHLECVVLAWLDDLASVASGAENDVRVRSFLDSLLSGLRSSSSEKEKVAAPLVGALALIQAWNLDPGVYRSHKYEDTAQLVEQLLQLGK